MKIFTKAHIDCLINDLIAKGQLVLLPLAQNGEKVVLVINSDDKHQITAVLAVTMSGEYLPPQLN